METRRKFEDIAVKLSAKINSGQLPDGSLLPAERELSKDFGASRTAVREALLALRSQGLVVMRPRARARITRLTNSTFFNQLTGSAQSLLAGVNGVADFQEARVLFECGLARYAARHASAKEVERLAAALAANKIAIGTSSFAKSDLAFHDILAEIPRNPIFTALNSALSEWLKQQRNVAIRIAGVARHAYKGHETIYKAIAGHDVERADKAMADHLQEVSRFYWQAITAKK